MALVELPQTDATLAFTSLISEVFIDTELLKPNETDRDCWGEIDVTTDAELALSLSHFWLLQSRLKMQQKILRKVCL
ncbi:unnamed protein product [Blepharisma stoltei]|uniref:Uncharacterized protein n=1 Tax=Blepharisma stoltei TaxID=1481888 RepID=A0AAU9JAI9_9CILI|nr:unnamed protein product [Blepharisma stoltei]